MTFIKFFELMLFEKYCRPTHKRVYKIRMPPPPPHFEPGKTQNNDLCKKTQKFGDARFQRDSSDIFKCTKVKAT